MEASAIPYKIPAPFASSNLSNATVPIPTAAQPNGFASWNEGWGVVNATNPSAGGIPPRWQDFLGLFYICSAWLQWTQAGGAPVAYDGTFQTTIGGYPNGALVASVTTPGLYWRSTADNNSGNPDTGGANWVPFPTGSLINVQFFNTAGTYTYTPTVGTTTVDITIQGGCGSGGGAPSTASGQYAIGAGGGAGGVARSRLSVAAATGQTITIGAGGTGVSGGNGNSGGSTSFGSLLSATGGVGGGVGQANANGTPAVQGPGSGGTGISGNLYSGVGQTGIPGMGTEAANCIAGAGAPGLLGGGATGPVNSTVDGNGGVTGGGSGGCAINGGGPTAGGVGAAGFCMILEYS